MAGIHCDVVESGPYGLKNDRQFMLVNERGAFLTQRELPMLSRFIPKLSGSKLTIPFQDDNRLHTLTIPLDADEKETIMPVWVWRKSFNAVHLKAYDDFFSDLLHTKCHLVKYHEKSSLQLSLEGMSEEIPSRSFVDSKPLLVIGTASLNDLNSRLSADMIVGWDRFRPNVVVETSLPYEEDAWETITIGNIQAKRVKSCARCVMVNVNQQNAKRGVEPLKTLSSYRKEGNKVLFGTYFAPTKHNGFIQLGNKVMI